VRHNFTGSEASGSVPIEIALLTTDVTNIVIVTEISLSEYSPISATGGYFHGIYLCTCMHTHMGIQSECFIMNHNSGSW